MRTTLRTAAIAAGLSLSISLQAAGQGTGLVADLLKDINELEGKIVGLAKAIPEASYAWRPSAGARSTILVVQHVAADNYFLPTVTGTGAPAATGIKPGDYTSVQAFETRKATRDEAIADLEQSFAHLKQAMQQTTPAQLSESLTVFGQQFTRQQFLILTTTHLHEHLGQLIAYARANNITPPWSR
jgi:uncharacterized damage-inducible protein DinB